MRHGQWQLQWQLQLQLQLFHHLPSLLSVARVPQFHRASPLPARPPSENHGSATSLCIVLIDYRTGIYSIHSM